MTHPYVNHRLVALILAICSAPVWAQTQVFRCGTSEYIDNAEVARSRGCKPMDGGNITIIQGTSVQAPKVAAPRAVSTQPVARTSGERVDSGAQRARDSDARAILEAELRKAQERLAQAQSAYANGAPEKEGIEGRNHQRYLDRVAELKANVARAESDVSSIQRELARFGGAASAPGTAAAQ